MDFEVATNPLWCFADNNECTAQPSLCGAKGQCLNTPGSYNCECQKGFSLDSSGVNCEGGSGAPRWLRGEEFPGHSQALRRLSSGGEVQGAFGQRSQGRGEIVGVFGQGQGLGWMVLGERNGPKSHQRSQPEAEQSW